MNGKYYKASDKFSAAGLVMMIVATTVVGMAISWVYLKLNSVCPVVYLCILMAALYGAAMGGVAYFFIKQFKLRSPKMVIIALSVALVFTTYFKWSLYDYFDRKDQYDYVNEQLTDTLNEVNDGFDEMGIKIDFDKPVLTVVDDVMNAYIQALTQAFGGSASDAEQISISDTLKSDETIKAITETYKEYSKKPGSDYKELLATDSEEGSAASSLLGGTTGALAGQLLDGESATYASYCEYYLERHPDASLWETMGMAALLGNSEDEIKDSIDKLGELSIKEYVLDYHGEEALEFLGYKGKKSIGKIMAQPGKLITDIKDINSEGRWSYSSSHSVSAEDKEPVHGFILWLVWLGELIVINAPAFAVAIPMCQRPFIESDNDWAQKHPTQFKFSAINAQALKSAMESDPLSLFNNQALVTAGGRTNYFTVTLYHSRSYMENYVSVDNTTYDQRRKTYNHKTFVNYLCVDTEFVGTLFALFGLNPPVGCHPSPLYSPTGYGSQFVPQDGVSVGEQNKGMPQQAQQAAPQAYQPAQPQQPMQQQPAAPTLQLQQPAQPQQPMQSSSLLGGSLLGGSLLGGGQPAPTYAPQPQTAVDADAIFGEQKIIKPKEENASGGINLLTGKPKTEEDNFPVDTSGTSGLMEGLDTSNLNLDDLK